jgi:hypothetical protein
MNFRANLPSLRTSLIALATLTLALIAAALIYPKPLQSFLMSRELAACETENDDAAAQIECAFRLIERTIDTKGLSAGMEAFTQSYTAITAFADTGCHKHAHRVGDIVYYKMYRPLNDLTKLDFPQSTTACGYGFYHGFMEHLIQDHPTIEFVTETCDYLSLRYGATMGDIRTICYHGAGHGLMLAWVEGRPRSQWGDAYALSAKPVAQCEALPSANEREKEECKEGIFNLIADWRDDKQYGFSLKKGESLFALCDRLPRTMRHACYYEMAQKVDKPSELDPVKLAAIAMGIVYPEYTQVVFDVGIAGIMQQVIAEGDRYKDVLASCVSLEERFSRACIESAVHGLYEHGEPQREHERAQEACRHEGVRGGPLEEACYTAVSGSLLRFYPKEKALSICEGFPEAYARACTEQIER